MNAQGRNAETQGAVHMQLSLIRMYTLQQLPQLYYDALIKRDHFLRFDGFFCVRPNGLTQTTHVR